MSEDRIKLEGSLFPQGCAKMVVLRRPCKNAMYFKLALTHVFPSSYIFSFALADFLISICQKKKQEEEDTALESPWTESGSTCQ